MYEVELRLNKQIIWKKNLFETTPVFNLSNISILSKQGLTVVRWSYVKRCADEKRLKHILRVLLQNNYPRIFFFPDLQLKKNLHFSLVSADLGKKTANFHERHFLRWPISAKIWGNLNCANTWQNIFSHCNRKKHVK